MTFLHCPYTNFPAQFLFLSLLWDLNATVFFLKIYLSIVDLECCVTFCCIKWFSYTYIYIFFCCNSFHYGLSQDFEYSLLSYTIGPCSLSILHKQCAAANHELPILPSFSPHLATTSLLFMPFFMSICFYLIDMFICVIF